MKFVGLDLGGVNSLACVRDDAGAESFHGSAYPERPSCVLLPLVRKEKLIAGDEALRNERGSGMFWPPLAMAAPDGWSRATPPSHGGRLLLATIWQRLNAGGQWSDAPWPPPPDGLPVPNKETPAECLAAEALSVLKRTHCDATTAEVALAIPNQLPEESQESLLGRLPAGARLVWRSVAAAMSWADLSTGHKSDSKHLAVLDAGLHGLEISVFDFRQQEMDGQMFRVPVRRLNRLRFANTDTLLADSPAPFPGLRPDLARLEPHLSEISNAVGGQAECLLCGPLAEPLLALLQRRLPSFSWSAPDANTVARGSCLFAWRLARGWPTYLDVLPSLELFVLDEHGKPHWLKLIAESHELAGGEEFEKVFDSACSVQKGTESLDNWLQRSGEEYFRHLTTKLPRVPERDMSLTLKVGARSAGGFARICMTSARGQAVFGASQSVMLDWQSMKKEKRIPNYPWPPDLVKHAWPDGGELLANRDFFREFLFFADRLEQTSRSGDPQQWSNLLPMLKEQVKRTISPFALGGVPVGDTAAPVNFLLCFGSSGPCRFWSNQGIITEQEIRRVAAMGSQLWDRLQKDERNRHGNVPDRKSLIYILGRFGGHAPRPFQDWLAGQIVPTSKDPILFAAGRALATADHGRKVFDCLKTKADFGQELKNNWLRMLVYLLYQRESFLEEAPREHILAAVRLALNAFVTQVDATRQRPMLFKNSLRTLALLLRIRRNRDCRDFLTDRAPTSEERAMTAELDDTLERALRLRLNDANRDLVKRTRDWLREASDTGVFPPIVTNEDVLTNDDEGGDEGINDA